MYVVFCCCFCLLVSLGGRLVVLILCLRLISGVVVLLVLDWRGALVFSFVLCLILNLCL